MARNIAISSPALASSLKPHLAPLQGSQQVAGMITEIQSLLAQVPFEPFSISMNDGKIYSVPSRDHIFLLLSKVIVKNDAGDFWWLAARNMTSLSGKSSASSTFDEPKPTQG